MAKLLQSWPAAGLGRRLSLALGYYVESVAEFRIDNAKSLAMAAISLETLLGGGLSSGITRGLSERGALLVARGDGALTVYRVLKKIYRARSKLVHKGARG
jgi:hypothetical protein